MGEPVGIEHTDRSDGLFREWRTRVHRMQIAHYDAATRLERLNLIFGVPVVVLSTTVGTTIFAGLQQSTSWALQLATGLCSVIAAVLASLQTFLRFGERASQHRLAGARYSTLKTELETVATFGLKDDSEVTEKFLRDFRGRWASLNEDSPTVPERIHTRALEKLESRRHD